MKALCKAIIKVHFIVVVKITMPWLGSPWDLVVSAGGSLAMNRPLAFQLEEEEVIQR